MRVKKVCGKVIGAELTSAERKAMDMEIHRQLSEQIQESTNNIDAMILWHLHEEFGFGKERLMRFYETIYSKMKELSNYYLMDIDKIPWMYKEKLKEYGIDIEELNKRRHV